MLFSLMALTAQSGVQTHTPPSLSGSDQILMKVLLATDITQLPAFGCCHCLLFAACLVAAGDPATPAILAEPPGDGLPALFLRFPNTSLETFYSYIASNTSIPDSTLVQQSVAALSLFNRPSNAKVTEAVPLTPADLKRLERW
jgi:hypothetical protein